MRDGIAVPVCFDSPTWVLQLQFGEGEKDMVAMFHTVNGRMPDGSLEEHASRLLAFGIPGGDTAMAATVGYTTGNVHDYLFFPV